MWCRSVPGAVRLQPLTATDHARGIDPALAAEGTIRRLYAESKGRNAVHASDSPASAEREVKLFFGVAALSH